VIARIGIAVLRGGKARRRSVIAATASLVSALRSGALIDVVAGLSCNAASSPSNRNAPFKCIRSWRYLRSPSRIWIQASRAAAFSSFGLFILLLNAILLVGKQTDTKTAYYRRVARHMP
jgi:hypothetical protein